MCLVGNPEWHLGRDRLAGKPLGALDPPSSALDPTGRLSSTPGGIPVNRCHPKCAENLVKHNENEQSKMAPTFLQTSLAFLLCLRPAGSSYPFEFTKTAVSSGRNGHFADPPAQPIVFFLSCLFEPLSCGFGWLFFLLHCLFKNGNSARDCHHFLFPLTPPSPQDIPCQKTLCFYGQNGPRGSKTRAVCTVLGNGFWAPVLANLIYFYDGELTKVALTPRSPQDIPCEQTLCFYSQNGPQASKTRAVCTVLGSGFWAPCLANLMYFYDGELTNVAKTTQERPSINRPSTV